MTQDTTLPPIRTEQIEALLEFLPVLEREDFRAWDGIHDGCYKWSAEVQALHDALYNDGWVVRFDWPAWQVEAASLLNDEGMLGEADMETLRKLLTTLARKEHFVTNAFPIACSDGHVTRVLLRMKNLHEACSEDSPTQ